MTNPNDTGAVQAQPDDIGAMCAELGTEIGVPAESVRTLMRSIMPKGSATDAIAFLAVAKKYRLNPLTKEIYAFPTQGGGIQPVVGIDGWLRMANDHDAFDGLVTEDQRDGEGSITAVTCTVHRKDRGHPIVVTEHMSECKRNTDPWKKWPARMLRHKAIIQALRVAFSFSGVMEPDEAERWREAEFEVKGGPRRKRSEADLLEQYAEDGGGATPAEPPAADEPEEWTPEEPAQAASTDEDLF